MKRDEDNPKESTAGGEPLCGSVVYPVPASLPTHRRDGDAGMSEVAMRIGHADSYSERTNGSALAARRVAPRPVSPLRH